MNPDQPGLPPPPPTNHYDFIINPQQQPKRSLSGISNNPFIMRLVIIIGGAVLMIVIALVVNLFFGSKTNVDDLVALTQNQQEIIRVSSQSKDATDQAIKNAAINTEVSLTTQQKEWLAFLNKHGRKVEAKELALKKDAETDKKLTSAKQTSTFDEAYVAILRAQLEAYKNALDAAFAGATNQEEKDLLKKHYTGVELLLQQWPK